MATEKFEPGETVRLMSGGPLMTVEAVDETSGKVTVVWFDKNILMQKIISAALLRKDDGMPFIG